jgi:hypothetical protein
MDQKNEEAEARPLVTVGIPGPIGSRERHLGPSMSSCYPARSGRALARICGASPKPGQPRLYSPSSTSGSAVGASPVMPSTTFTFSSISAIIAGLSLRYIFAFSRPWPIFWPL